MPIRLGATELALLLVIVLLVFGVGKLPQVGQALGKGIRQFRRGLSDKDEETARIVTEDFSGTRTNSKGKA